MHPVEEVSVVRDIEVYLSLRSLDVLVLDAMGLVYATDGGGRDGLVRKLPVEHLCPLFQ
jgi:hypothetical protein